MAHDFHTPYELGNRDQTTTWQECIAFYERLAARFPGVLSFGAVGHTDSGHALHAGVLSADGVFDRERIKREGRFVFFNNNGIHPGEPEGIDAAMALVRDLCVDAERRAALGNSVLLFIPIYNVDGCLNRKNTSRVNQLGPELFGFRGNARHLDLNRDFIKCDSLNAQSFNQLFSAWDPDVMVDTHTSNGADYPYTMTLIPTQPDKLGGDLGTFLRETMLPHLYATMAERGWPTCPYVNPCQETPEQGIEDFLETPRFSTGYAALHHTIGFMPETHMLKPFRDRYASMRTLLDVTLEFSVAHAKEIQRLRAAARQDGAKRSSWPIAWRVDQANPSQLRFKGYAAKRSPSRLGNYQRLAYAQNEPWERDIPYFNRFVPVTEVSTPKAYVIPQAWREVIERLTWNGVALERLTAPRRVQARTYRILSVVSRRGAYEGHLFHDALTLETRSETFDLQAGDCWVPLDQPRARYVMETLEPEAHDSFFRWGFFNSVLEKKEGYSDYVFEDLAERLLEEEPELRARFEQWKAQNPSLVSSQIRVLDFIFENCQRFAEPAWRRYPVLAIPRD